LDVCASLVAGAQALERVEPGEGSFDDPADLAQPGGVRDAAAGDARDDAALAQEPAVLVEVIAAGGEQLVGLAPRPPAPAADRGDRVEQREQLGDVVAVPAGQRDRERDAVGADDQVVPGAGMTAVDRGRPTWSPP
jgi:hypothetical protein